MTPNQHVPPSAPGDPTDVVVVGGGLAGLIAGIEAASAGARVAILETSSRAGGRARTDERNGVSFNHGPHALYEAGAAMTALRELGIDPPGGHPAVSGRAVWGGQVGRLPFDPWSLVTTRLLRPSSRLAFARFYTQLPRIDARSYDSTTVAQLLAERFGERADVRALVAGLVRVATYVNAPELFSAGAAIDQLLIARSGVRYLDRGWGALTAALVDTAQRVGAALHLDTPVRAVEPDGARWVVADAHGHRWSTGAVVLAGLSPEMAERLAGVESGAVRAVAGPPARAACLDLVLEAPPAVTFALDLDHADYYSLHAPVADLAPPGRSLVSLAHYRRPDEDADAEHDRAQLRGFARRMGVDTALDERYLHDMTVTHGIPLAARGGLAGRPAVDALGRPGLLLAGDWVGPTGLLADAAVASGRAAGHLAARLAREMCAA